MHTIIISGLAWDLIKSSIEPFFLLLKNRKRGNFSIQVYISNYQSVFYTINHDDNYSLALSKIPESHKKLFKLTEEIPIKAQRIEMIFENGNWLIDVRGLENKYGRAVDQNDKHAASCRRIKKLSFIAGFVLGLILAVLVF